MEGEEGAIGDGECAKWKSVLNSKLKSSSSIAACQA